MDFDSRVDTGWPIYIIRLNGIYDIVCSLSILHLVYIPGLRELHLGMLINREQNNIHEPYFAYWIFTYGAIRLYGADMELIAYSYYIEAAVVAFECFVKKTMMYDKSIFVIITCILLGYLCHMGFCENTLVQKEDRCSRCIRRWFIISGYSPLQ